MANTIPYEILVGSGTAYIAPVGTALPPIGGLIEAPWVKIGAAGDLNYDEDTGVEFTVTEDVKEWAPLGSNSPVKQFRTVEGVGVKLEVADMTLEQLRYALNFNSVAVVPAAGGAVAHRKIGLSKGMNLITYALLVRYNVTPYQAEGIMEYRHTRVQQRGEFKPIAKKGEPMLTLLEFKALVDPNAAEAERLGVWVAQDDAGT